VPPAIVKVRFTSNLWLWHPGADPSELVLESRPVEGVVMNRRRNLGIMEDGRLAITSATRRLLFLFPLDHRQVHHDRSSFAGLAANGACAAEQSGPFLDAR
jgi:hypothetical protein